MKYELDTLIYYMKDSKVHSAPVLARMQVDNAHEDWGNTNEQRNLFTPFGKGGVFYGTCHGTVNEINAFATKEELLQSL